MKYALALCLFISGCTADKLTHGVPNLHEVRAGVWRGGQPTDEGWHYLHDILLLTNDIKLNTEAEGSDATAKALGMRVVYVPITTEQQMFGPVEPQLRIAVSNITDHSFVHCKRGVNRTGSAVILYRVEHDGWTKSNAVYEANQYGWSSSFHALKDFVEDKVK